jgi:hypothetical protein
MDAFDNVGTYILFCIVISVAYGMLLLGLTMTHHKGRNDHEHRRRHRLALLVFFLRGGTNHMPPQIVNQLVANDTNGIYLLVAETLKGEAIPLSKGPFTVNVDDSAKTGVVVVPGSPDLTTPPIFKAPPAPALLADGQVNVTVTDTSVTPPISATASFQVVQPAPPPPPPPPTGPDAISAQFATVGT